MLVTNRSLMGPQQPSFQKAGDAVAGRQEILADLARATNHRVPIPTYTTSWGWLSQMDSPVPLFIHDIRYPQYRI